MGRQNGQEPIDTDGHWTGLRTLTETTVPPPLMHPQPRVPQPSAAGATTSVAGAVPPLQPRQLRLLCLWATPQWWPRWVRLAHV